MDAIEQLLERCVARQHDGHTTLGADELASLQAGIAGLRGHLAKLQGENRALKARGQTLEQQVMDFAHEADTAERQQAQMTAYMWGLLEDDDDDDDDHEAEDDEATYGDVLRFGGADDDPYAA